MTRLSILATAAVLAMAGSATAQDAPKDPPVIKIGAIFAMSGQASWYGQVMSQGMRLAVDEINAKGGVDGIKLEAVIEDHKGAGGAEGVAAINRLMSLHGTKIVMTSFTGPTLGIAPIADQNNIFLINGGGVGVKMVGASKYIVHNRSLSSDLALGALQVAQEMGLKKMGQLHWKNDVGDYIVSSAEPVWKKGGGTIVATEAVPQGATNMDTQVAKVRAANPDVVGMWMFTPEVGLAVKRVREFGMKQPVIGVEFTANDAKVAGATAEGFLYINDYFKPSDDQPWSKQFAAAYEKRWGQAPEFYGANYYEGVYMAAELAKRSRKKGGDYLNGERLKAALYENPKIDSVYGGQMTFQENGVAQKRVGLFKVEGGTGVFQKFVDLK
ncbi:amino acid/amide ABC transporter substrate-binding protein (HAAT family) [Stella humosa]|uniref:Amino acid/amide ABC transporter substrate-binding protein (HAAT family) n=1 Tax=Stella humosa TaxID=94 RepID=A0A3N1MDN7_9PROT|nr:ABC transporter substrate-binding protein [Stella humosa]ROQ01833.1 amino acid/amide ABC transporter substrate-binding protein (HAAT family) [Stella humosa]